ncbi:MAG: recombinase family protein, partial [Daejeonella sp.]
MIYGYIRVSSDKQTTANQKFEIGNYCKIQGISLDRLIEETISSTKKIEERKLGKLLRQLKKGDLLVVSELSRLGRNLM